jgi:hypothetical protein
VRVSGKRADVWMHVIIVVHPIAVEGSRWPSCDNEGSKEVDDDDPDLMFILLDPPLVVRSLSSRGRAHRVVNEIRSFGR